MQRTINNQEKQKCPRKARRRQNKKNIAAIHGYTCGINNQSVNVMSSNTFQVSRINCVLGACNSGRRRVIVDNFLDKLEPSRFRGLARVEGKARSRLNIPLALESPLYFDRLMQM